MRDTKHLTSRGRGRRSNREESGYIKSKEKTKNMKQKQKNIKDKNKNKNAPRDLPSPAFLFSIFYFLFSQVPFQPLAEMLSLRRSGVAERAQTPLFQDGRLDLEVETPQRVAPRHENRYDISRLIQVGARFPLIGTQAELVERDDLVINVDA